MANPIQDSPYQSASGTAVRFPDRKIHKHLVIRVESGGTFKVHVKIGPTDASSTIADFFLDSGEALKIDAMMAQKGSDVSLIPVTGTPKIFYIMG